MWSAHFIMVAKRLNNKYPKRLKNMEKISTLMKKMNVLEVIEQIVELTNAQGIATEMKKGKPQLAKRVTRKRVIEETSKLLNDKTIREAAAKSPTARESRQPCYPPITRKAPDIM